MRRHGWVIGLCLAQACASGDESAPSGGRQQNPASRPAPRAEMDAPMGAAGGASLGDTGNSDFDPSEIESMAPPDAGAPECMPGMRCYDESDPDEMDCGSLTLEAEVEVIEHPGNVLLVFDRSGSMRDDWNGQTRWEAAGAAIRNALTPLVDKLTIGSVFFPSSDPDAMPQCVDPTGITCILLPWLVLPTGTCGVNAITEPDQIAFVPGPEFLTAFTAPPNTAPLYAPIPDGRTPLKEGLLQAQTAIASSTLTGITAVVVITDGDPNCEWDAAVSRQIVTDWQAMGIATHVVGLPGTTDAGDAVLNDLAAAGGTGTYITPEDAAGLEQRLREIATETVRSGFDSCEITINPPAEVPDKLHLVVTEGGVDQDVPRELSADAGWTISDDGAVANLEGRLCDDAQGGRFEALRFEFGCVDLPPLPPPKEPPPVE